MKYFGGGSGSGGGAVSSVFGRVGAVLAQLGDYTSSLITNASSVAGATVTAALNTLSSALSQLVFQAPAALGNLGATEAIAFASNPYQIGTLDQNCTITIATLPVGYEGYLELIQGGVGSFTVTWGANIDWTDGLPPILTTTATKRDLLKFVSNGSRLRGYVVLMNF